MKQEIYYNIVGFVSGILIPEFSVSVRNPEALLAHPAGLQIVQFCDMRLT